MGEVRIRPMRADDVPTAAAVSSAGFLELDRATSPRSWPEPEPRSEAGTARWVRRTTHVVGTDPGGCWVAEDDGAMLGFTVSLRRELMWILSSFNVLPAHQGAGIGRALFAVTEDYGKGCLRAMLSSSDDARAVRRYRSAGFDLHPQIVLRGVVDRSAIPVVEHVRDGTPGNRDLLDSLDRRTRGAAHGPDHDVLLDSFRLLVSDRPSGSGYAYVDEAGVPALVAATDQRTASRLTWEGLAAAPTDEPVEIHHVTAANQWALDVGLAAGLATYHQGFLGLRRLKPPAPYLHHGALL